jgi:cyclopropane fatty-acyl-phospholipid synthase-like methyltransferase
MTGLNRYPDVFSECVRYFGGKSGLRILSFGCSTGEEVVTLREYFPDAEIVGAEINKRSLKKCRALKVDDKITFVHSSDDRLGKLGTFDAVFCMAVFQRTPQYIADAGIRDLSRIYPFAKFEKQIDFLSDMVKTNGLLIVHFTQYNLEDTRAALKFSAFGDCTQRSYDMPVFDKHCKFIESPIPWHSIFIKK